MTVLRLPLFLTAVGFWMPQESSSRLLPNDTEPLSPAGGRAAGLQWGTGVPRGHQKRFLSRHDMSMILDYHNQVRAQVSPPAANMEYMVSQAPVEYLWVLGGVKGLTWDVSAQPGRDGAPTHGDVRVCGYHLS